MDVQVRLFNQPFAVYPHPKGGQAREYRFGNGYGASLIPYGRGNSWELAVLRDAGTGDWKLAYDTGITGDVIPGLSDDEANLHLIRISELSPVSREAVDGPGLLNGLLAFYSQRSEFTRVTAADLLIHAAMLVRHLPEDLATEWLSEDLTDRRAARG